MDVFGMVHVRSAAIKYTGPALEFEADTIKSLTESPSATTEILSQEGMGVLVGVSVGVPVSVGVSLGPGVSLGRGVLGMAVGILNGRGVLMARVARNCSTMPWRKEARWIMSGSMPKAGRTIKVKS